jgi:hypothetical protein
VSGATVVVSGAPQTLRSHLSVTDLAKLAANGPAPAGASPLLSIEDGDVIEVQGPV